MCQKGFSFGVLFQEGFSMLGTVDVWLHALLESLCSKLILGVEMTDVPFLFLIIFVSLC